MREHNKRLIAEWKAHAADKTLDKKARSYYAKMVKDAEDRGDEALDKEDFDFIDAYDFFSLINKLAKPGLSPGWAIVFNSLRLILGFLARRGRW